MNPRDDFFTDSRVLVVVDLSKPGWKDLTPFELLSSVDVVLLGLYRVTEQVTPDQARDEFGKEANRHLEELEKRFSHAGVSVDKRLLFCSDFVDAIDRVAEETDCSAILTWNESLSFDRIGVFLRAEERRDNLLNNVAYLMLDQDQALELTYFIDDETELTEEEARSVMGTEVEYLVDRGLSEDQVSIRVETVDDVDEALGNAAGDYDAVVMGETKPSVASVVFGKRHELVRKRASGPVLVVRYPRE